MSSRNLFEGTTKGFPAPCFHFPFPIEMKTNSKPSRPFLCRPFLRKPRLSRPKERKPRRRMRRVPHPKTFPMGKFYLNQIPLDIKWKMW